VLDLGVAELGAIQLDPVETWVSRRGYEADVRSPGASPDAVVWTQVTHRAYAESELSFTNVSFMTMATLIAAIGIVLDSQILVIGATVLGPEFGAVAALALSLVRRRPASASRPCAPWSSASSSRSRSRRCSPSWPGWWAWSL
jgi:hypothetical protein